MLVELLESTKQLTNIALYEKHLDPAAYFGIKDDSQNDYSLCVIGVKI